VAFSSAFKAIADDPNGEALAVRVYLRADTGAGSDQLITLTGLEEAISVSDVKRYREREFGIVQGQQWEVKLANVYDTFNPDASAWLTTESSILLKWIALEVGFPAADEWELVAQGRIHKITASTDGSVTIQAGDPIMDLLLYELPRDQVFDERDAWVSPVQTVAKSTTSKDFLHTTGPAIDASFTLSNVYNETFRMVFATPTTYNVVYEDGTTQTGGPFNIATATVDIVSNQSAGAVVRIYTADWDATPGAYAAGDEYVLYTSRQYTAALLQPVALVQQLILEAGRLLSYDVIGGTSQLVYADVSHWGTVNAAFSTTTCRGYWPKGTSIMEMIQGLLKVMNATIFPTTDGTIAIWYLGPGEVGDTTQEISGEPDADVVAIASATRGSDHADLANSTLWRYGFLEFTAGADGQVPTIQELVMPKDDLAATTFVDPVTAEPVVRHKEISVGWAVDSATVDAASNRYLNRFKVAVPTYTIRGTLARILTSEITDAVSITEPFLAESHRKILVAQIGLRPLENVAELHGWMDPVLAEEYARVDVSVWDGSDLVF
jgi:hypothetical protein